MKRILFDTNIYGLLARDLIRIELISKMEEKKDLIVYGCKIIRKELRDTPKQIRIDGKNLRIDLLNVYDQIIKEHVLNVTNEVKDIANSYYKAYREFGGSKSKEDIISDFKIVACACINGLDVVVSNDAKSMVTENAIRAYKLINPILKKRTPRFIDFIRFKNYLRGGESNEFI